jgi:hypothetical protein
MKKPQKIPQELITHAAKLTLQNPCLSIIPDTDEYPWFIREYQKKLQLLESRTELLLPNVKDNNESIAVFSDYGGESSDSKYHTYSFLICAWNQTGTFTREMDKLRDNHGLNDPFKEIAFKDFRYGPIKRSLDQYLKNLSNFVNGYLFTVVIDKSVGTVFGENNKETSKHLVNTLKDNGFGDWKPNVAEKLLRITHFSAYLVALLSREGQKVIWMTDHDSIAPTSEHFNKTLKLFSNLLNHYCKHNLSTVGGAVPFEEKSSEFLDLLSATDITAGTIEHYMTRAHGKNEEPDVKEEANQVLCWLSGQGVALKKYSMIIRKEGDEIVSGTLEFKLKETDPDVMSIPVVVNKKPSH